MKLNVPRLYRKKKRVIQQATKSREEAGDDDDIITQATMGLQMNNLVSDMEHGMMTLNPKAASSFGSSVATAKAKGKAKPKAKATERSAEPQTAEEELELADAGGFVFDEPMLHFDVE